MPEKVKFILRARLLFLFMRSLPTRWRRSLFCILALSYYYIAPRRRITTLTNLRKAFPHKSTQEIKKIARGAYRNIAIVAAEFADLPFLTKGNIGNLLDVEGLEHCKGALEKNRGLLLFGAHFGNWEIAAAAIPFLLKSVTMLYRPLDNVVLENLVTWVRQSTGNITIAKESAMWPMVRILKRNGIIGLLIDQNVASYEGVFVDYFGTPACTTNGLAHLALLMDTPVIPAFMVRQEGNRYRLIFGPEVELIRTEDRERDIVENTRIFTAITEKMVRQYPGQWLWLHDRWKEKMSEAASHVNY